MIDLQPLSERRPWWFQAVQNEMMTFDLKQVRFQSDFDNDSPTRLTLTGESIQGKIFMKILFTHFFNSHFSCLVYYMKNDHSERSHIAQLSSSNGELIK